MHLDSNRNQMIDTDPLPELLALIVVALIVANVNSAKANYHFEPEMSIRPPRAPHKAVWEVSWDGNWNRCGECRSYPQSRTMTPPWEWYLLEVGTCSTLAQPRVGAVSGSSFQCRGVSMRQVGR